MWGSDLTGDHYRQHHEGGAGMPRYGFSIGGEARAAWFAERVAEIAKRRKKEVLDILDVGCRDGALTKRYAGKHRVVGLDVDPEAIARASRDLGIDARKVDLNREPIPSAAGTFDVVVAGEVLEHLQFPKVVVREVRRVLRPGGAFFGSVPNAFRLGNRLRFLMGEEIESDPTHLHQFSPRSLRALLSDFTQVSLEFHGGRRRDWHPRLFATQLHWRTAK